MATNAERQATYRKRRERIAHSAKALHEAIEEAAARGDQLARTLTAQAGDVEDLLERLRQHFQQAGTNLFDGQA